MNEPSTHQISSEAASTPPTPKPARAPKNATRRAKRSIWNRWRKGSAHFFMLSVAFHALLLAGAAIWVVQTIQTKRKLSFSGRPPSNGARGSQLEYRVQTAKRSQSLSAPPAATRITASSSASKVTLPDAPSFNSATSAIPSRMAGIAGAGISLSMTSNRGAMSALPMPAASVNVFGFRGGGGAGLVGTFYDLKQKANKTPHGEASAAVDDLKLFVKNWDPSILAKYYRAKTELSSQRLYIPETLAEEAPRAFGAENDVKASLWVVHYRGKVIPPKAGTFRFRGKCSDWLTVRFDHKNVYDGGSSSVFALDQDVSADKSVYIKMVPTKTYEMEILIGNYPGGVVYASLFLEEQGKAYEKDPNGEDLLPLFQIGKMDPPKIGPDSKHAPPFAKDPMIFRISR